MMAPLNSNEIQQLAASIEEDLTGTDYACSSLDRIPGGSASFTFSGVLKSPLQLLGKRPVATVIVKKATNYAAINSDFALDSSRSTYEDAMLKALSHVELTPQTVTIPVRTPLTFFYMSSSRIQIIEDLRPAIDLASILTSPASVTLQPDFAAVGFALGAWLRAFHSWTRGSEQAELRRVMKDNEASRGLKWRTTYDTIVEIAQMFPTIKREDLDVLEEVRERALREYEYALQARTGETHTECYGLIHADFWSGNVLLSPVPVTRIHIIDFEFAYLGHYATDLGQMVGDLLEKSYMSDSESSTRSNCGVVIDAFAKGYSTITDDMALRVVIHAGVHMINWCARHPGAELRGKVEGFMQRAIEIIVKAWKGERKAFDDDVLGCLF